MSNPVFDGVQAELLNSECAPQQATEQALAAVALFAASEDVVLTEEEWIEGCRKAYQKATEGV